MTNRLGLFRLGGVPQRPRILLHGGVMSSLDRGEREVVWLSFWRDNLDGRQIPLHRILYRLMLGVW